MNQCARNQENIEPIISDLSFGLNDDQIKSRRDDGLVNRISKTVTKSYLRIIVDNVFNFFNILLFAISIFMVVTEANSGGLDPRDFMFAYLLIVNIIIGLYQDLKARRQVEKLKVVSYPIVKVIRNGKEESIPANELVLSDIAILKSGDQIIADSTIMAGNIEVNESAISGESNNVLKKPGDKIFSGSYLTSGFAKVRVDRVGKANYVEMLQNKARQFKRPKSEILLTINKIFKLIGIIVIVLGTMMAITYATNGGFNNNLRETSLRFSSSLISMIPIGMYLLVSLTLAVGVIRLAGRRTLVQELYCIEMLARVDVLCLDKTGTITDGTMSLHNLNIISKNSKDDIENILITLVKATGDDNPTARAITNAYSSKTVLSYHLSLPFNSARKFSAVMLNDGRCFVLGAREFLPHESKGIDSVCEDYEKQGFRVLLLGYSKRSFTNDESVPDLESIAIVVLEDHIKEDATKNIQWFKNNGVAIKIISGDNPASVAEIAHRVGVENAEKYISLEAMPLDEVRKIANEYTVFGRVSPEQKEVIVESLQSADHVVAMTGDGVNDVLALKVADCSIAMANGSDAAKAVSHLVSLDSNFSSLPDVVSEGRRVINNLQRTCAIFLIKSFFAMVITVVFLFASWIGRQQYPFVPNNMYVWELLTIGISSFFLSLQPNSEKLKDSFFSNILTKSIPGAVVQSAFALVFFLLSAIISNYNSGYLNTEAAICMSVITFTVLSYVTLLIISKPFDIYRVVLSIAIGILIISFFLIDRFVLYSGTIESSFFKINYNAINTANWWILLVVIAVAIPSYLGINRFVIYISKKLAQKEGNKNENF